MNFYKRFIGDYASKTAHLSLTEHGAYTLLLDAIYATERGLPVAYADLYRICRAMSKAEQAAVSRVADEFFPVGEDGLRHNRKAIEVMDDAAPALAAARENGKLGGRPKKPKQEPAGFSGETHDEPNSKASQSHSQNSPSLRSGEKRGSRLPSPFELPEEWRDFCRTERPDLDPRKVADKFADFWHAKPGKDGVKLDWLKTWRNWVRDERAPKVPAGDIRAVTTPTNPADIYKPEPRLTPEQLAANKANAAKQLAALKAGGLKTLQ